MRKYFTKLKNVLYKKMQTNVLKTLTLFCIWYKIGK